MKKFICCLLSVLLFTMPVYAGEIKGEEKIGGIEKIGDIPTGSITAIEKTDLEYAPSIHNVKSGLDEEYTFFLNISHIERYDLYIFHMRITVSFSNQQIIKIFWMDSIYYHGSWKNACTG